MLRKPNSWPSPGNRSTPTKTSCITKPTVSLKSLLTALINATPSGLKPFLSSTTPPATPEKLPASALFYSQALDRTQTGSTPFARGDQSVRGAAGYVGEDGIPRLNVLDLQRLIRSMPKVVIALVAGYAIGGGHVLHLICDLSIAADNAIFGQTGPKVGSFDGGFGASYLARVVGQKKAREIWFLCRQYSAEQALAMGLVNTVVPVEQLEAEGVAWAQEILQKSPIAIRCLKSAFNADCDGQAGLQELAGNATLLYYLSEEGAEGKQAFLEKRSPDFSQYPWLP